MANLDALDAWLARRWHQAGDDWVSPYDSSTVAAFCEAWPHMAAVAPVALHSAAGRLLRSGVLVARRQPVGEHPCFRRALFLSSRERLVFIQFDTHGHPTRLIARDSNGDSPRDHIYAALPDESGTLLCWKLGERVAKTLIIPRQPDDRPVRYWASPGIAVAAFGPTIRLSEPPKSTCKIIERAQAPTWCEPCRRSVRQESECPHLRWCKRRRLHVLPTPEHACLESCVSGPCPALDYLHGVVPALPAHRTVASAPPAPPHPRLLAWLLRTAPEPFTPTDSSLVQALASRWPACAVTAEATLTLAAEELLARAYLGDRRRRAHDGAWEYRRVPTTTAGRIIFVEFGPDTAITRTLARRSGRGCVIDTWYTRTGSHQSISADAPPVSIDAPWAEAPTQFWAAPGVAVCAQGLVEPLDIMPETIELGR